MGLLKTIIKATIASVKPQINGAAGETRVRTLLDSRVFGKVEHRLINNLVLVDDNGKSHQIDHVEIRHNGIFCIETKNYIGWIFGNENSEHWTQSLYTGQKNQFLNPLKQNKSHCYYISKALDNKYKINSVVVMVNNNAEKIDCENVVNYNDLKPYLNKFDNGVSLSLEEMDAIYNKLLSCASKITNKEHVQNIRKTQNEVKANICPRCGGKLVLREGSNGTFYGCSNYPKCRFTKKV